MQTRYIQSNIRSRIIICANYEIKTKEDFSLLKCIKIQKIKTKTNMKTLKMSQKSLILMAKNLKAIDITTTTINPEESRKFNCIAISVGASGINAAIFENKGKFYVIKRRTTNIFVLL